MGMIFDIQRCCCDDGPGVRTTVFFKGCPLRCAWCHNPESFQKQPQLRFVQHMCIGCGACIEICPVQAHALVGRAHRVDHAVCIACGRCAHVCHTGALQIVGYEASAQQIMETVLRDKAYYETSGGGLTISGGEPTMQPEFLIELLSLAKAQNIHTCLETNGYIPQAVLQSILPLVDLFLLDYKLTDREELRDYTGASGELWEQCLHALQAHPKPVILRLPIIPGINDTDAHLQQAAYLAKHHSCIEKVQVMPYHTIGEDKWQQLGYAYPLAGKPAATSDQKIDWQRRLDALL